MEAQYKTLITHWDVLADTPVCPRAADDSAFFVVVVVVFSKQSCCRDGESFIRTLRVFGRWVFFIPRPL